MWWLFLCFVNITMVANHRSNLLSSCCVGQVPFLQKKRTFLESFLTFRQANRRLSIWHLCTVLLHSANVWKKTFQASAINPKDIPTFFLMAEFTTAQQHRGLLEMGNRGRRYNLLSSSFHQGNRGHYYEIKVWELTLWANQSSHEEHSCRAEQQSH